MENISGELKRAELQKETPFQAHEQAHSQAPSVLSFSLQWKDLEERFHGIRTSLECRAKELDEEKRLLRERIHDITLREEALREGWQRVEEREEEEVRRKKMDLRSVEERLEECRVEHGKEKSQFDALRECNSLIMDKDKELRSLMQATEECRRAYDSKKEEVEVLRQELGSKEKKVGVVQSLLEENARELDVKVEELGSVKRSLDECSRTVKSARDELTMVQSLLDHSRKAHDESEKRLSVLERTIEERDKEVAVKAGKLQSLEDKMNDCQVELRVKEEELHSINMLIEEHKEELKSKKREFEDIDRLINERLAALALKDRELGSIETSIGRLSKERESREAELENMMKRVEPCNEETESKKEDLASVQAKLEEVAKSLELKSREFDAVQACIKVRNLELASRKRQLELGRQRLDSIEKSPEKRSKEMELRERTSVHSGVVAQNVKHPLINSVSQLQIAQELHQVLGSAAVLPGSLGCIQQWQIKTEEPERCAVHNADDSSVEYPPPPTIARKDLQLFQTELSNENAMICKEISHVLENSSDPAKLVLDVIVGSYAQYSNTKDMNLQTDVMRSQIATLELLMRISPSMTHEVKEGAMKLAREWIAKLSDKPESALEVLVFQNFVAAYDLLSLFNDAPPLGQTLGFVDEITATASLPASLSRAHQQPPREKKRSASDAAIDVQSQPCAHECKYEMNNQGGPP